MVQHLGGEAWGHSVADLLRELADRHDASDVLQDNVQFEVELDLPTRTTAGST